MSQKLLVFGFNWVKNKSQFIKDSVTICNEDSDEGYVLEVDVQYHEILNNFYNDLPILPDRIKNRNFEKLVANLYDKREYIIHIKNLKQAIYHEFLLKKVHKVINLKQVAWFKPYIDITLHYILYTKLRKKTKNHFKNDFRSW